MMKIVSSLILFILLGCGENAIISEEVVVKTNYEFDSMEIFLYGGRSDLYVSIKTFPFYTESRNMVLPLVSVDLKSVLVDTIPMSYYGKISNEDSISSYVGQTYRYLDSILQTGNDHIIDLNEINVRGSMVVYSASGMADTIWIDKTGLFFFSGVPVRSEKIKNELKNLAPQNLVP